MADTSRSHGNAAKRAKHSMEAKGRKPTGQVRPYSGASGVVTYSLRVRWRGQRLSIRLGSELEGWNRPLADRKLRQTIAEIEAGVWRPPVADIAPEERDPFFHEFATFWLDRHTVDLAGNTKASYSHILARYLLPEFKDHRLSEITHELVQRRRDRLRQEAEALKLAKQSGVSLLDRRGKPKRPFGSRTINEALRLLGQILERAVESEHYTIQRNPVKGRSGLRMKKPGKPPREHLEADEVLSMIRAADLLDQGVTPRSLERAKLARDLRAQGMTWEQIGQEMACAETTAIYLSRIAPRRNAPRRRRAMIVMLSLTGTRASEHTELVWGRIDHTHGRIVVDDSKSDAGVREIYMSPFVREEVALYRASLPRIPEPSDPVFPVRGGGSGDRFNLGRRLKHIALVAAEMRKAAGLAPMPTRITPHSFRRTFITLSFQAGKDLVFVQSQAGHANWKTTLEIYTQQSGRSIDRKIRNLLEEFLGEPSESVEAEASHLTRSTHGRPDVS
jgi:integrase